MLTPYTLKRNVPVLGALACLLLGFAGCGHASATFRTKPIVIGISLSTSGDFSDDSRYFKQGYELWADTVNSQGGLLGRPVLLKILNDASTPEQVTTNYQTLITVDHVDLLFAPFSSLSTRNRNDLVLHGYLKRGAWNPAGTVPRYFVRYPNVPFASQSSVPNLPLRR